MRNGAAALMHWQARLRLSDWHIRLVRDLEPDAGDRSTVDMHANIRQALIRLRSDTPIGQEERQVVHELLHVRLVAMEKAYIGAKEWTPRGADDALDALWSFGEEAAIEALVDALGCAARADWGPAGEPFIRAFPPDGSAA